jgi:hypothetical protein
MVVACPRARFVACLLAATGCARFGYDPIEAKGASAITGADAGTVDATSAGSGGNADDADIGAPGGQGGGAASDDGATEPLDTSVLDVLSPPDVAEPPDVAAPPPDVVAEDASSPDADAASDALPPPAGLVVDFSAPGAVLLNGAAKIDGTSLDLVTGDYFQAGSAYLPTPYPIGPATTFSIAFAFRIY